MAKVPGEYFRVQLICKTDSGALATFDSAQFRLLDKSMSLVSSNTFTLGSFGTYAADVQIPTTATLYGNYFLESSGTTGAVIRKNIRTIEVGAVS